jgi:dTDP-4-dehydrorhamnose reductase
MAKFRQGDILCTGGRGRLGRELQKLLPRARFPSSSVFDVTNVKQMGAYLRARKPKILIHAAAFTSPPLVDKDPERAIDVNIIATAHIAKLCRHHHIKLVYVSTDYVFKGDKGNYTEEDPVLPVNKYAWSKLAGECAVRMLDDYLIIRTSFGEKKFPYEKAFADQYTSRESVDVIAKKIIKALQADTKGVLHLGHSRRSVYNYARSLGAKNVGKLFIKDASFSVPRDTSLNTVRYKKLSRSKPYGKK